MPEKHKAVADWTPERLRKWAARTGARTEAYIVWLMEQREQPDMSVLPFEERIALLVEAEWLSKRSKRIDRLVVKAGFRFPAAVEDIDYLGKHGITKLDVQRLCEGSYLRKKQNIIIAGPTGVGKTYLASALGRSACFQGIPLPISGSLTSSYSFPFTAKY